MADEPITSEPVCTACGRSGAGAAGAWTFSRPPRPTGRTTRTADEERTTVHCPECSRRALRDLEARLDP